MNTTTPTFETRGRGRGGGYRRRGSGRGQGGHGPPRAGADAEGGGLAATREVGSSSSTPLDDSTPATTSTSPSSQGDEVKTDSADTAMSATPARTNATSTRGRGGDNAGMRTTRAGPSTDSAPVASTSSATSPPLGMHTIPLGSAGAGTASQSRPLNSLRNRSEPPAPNDTLAQRTEELEHSANHTAARLEEAEARLAELLAQMREMTVSRLQPSTSGSRYGPTSAVDRSSAALAAQRPEASTSRRLESVTASEANLARATRQASTHHIYTARLSGGTVLSRPPGSPSSSIALTDRSIMAAQEALSPAERTRVLNVARQFLHPHPDLPSLRIGLSRQRWERLPRELRRRLLRRDDVRPDHISCVVNGCHTFFDLAERWLTHLEEDHFVCDVCSNVFVDNAALRSHRRHANHEETVLHRFRLRTISSRASPGINGMGGSQNSWDVSVEDSESNVSEDDDSEEELDSDEYMSDEDDEDYDSDETVEPYCDMCGTEYATFESLQDHLDYGTAHANGRMRPTNTTALTTIQTALRDIATASYSKSPIAKPTGQCPWPIPCGICLETCEELTSTLCGHVGCRRCLQQAIARSRSCPVCRRTTRLKDLHPIFLSGTAPSDLFLSSA